MADQMRKLISLSCLTIGILIFLLLVFTRLSNSPSSSSTIDRSYNDITTLNRRKRTDTTVTTTAGSAALDDHHHLRPIPADISVPDNKKHKPNRIAIIIPYIASDTSTTTLPPYFSAFATAAIGSASIVDFLIFHNNLPQHALLPYQKHSTNIKFINVGSMHDMANLFIRVTDQRKHLRDEDREDLVKILARHLIAYPYVLVEFKPALGHIFADYLKDYSHWGYSDLDIAFGDIPRWITPDELTEFDIVTYGYGDQDRIYLRGQFTFHKNTPLATQLWRGCQYLSKIDERFSRVAAGKDKLHFESAEGCYSAVVLQQTNIKIKYATKAFTDVTTSDTAYTHGMYLGVGSRSKSGGKERTVVVYKAGKDVKHGDGTKILKLSPQWFETDDVYSDNTIPLQTEVGERTAVQLMKDRRGIDPQNIKCMYWAPKEYQKDICAYDVKSDETVFFIHGVIYKQKHETVTFPGNVISYPFFHFQEWKHYYRSAQLESLQHPSVGILGWVLGKEGAIPLLPTVPSALDRTLATQQQISNWMEGEEMHHRDDLPLSLYCLRSSKKKFPPVPRVPNCDEIVSWQDSSTVTILLDGGSSWNNIDVNADVTLALTLQLSRNTMDYAIVQGLLDLTLQNIKAWGKQPIVLVIHVAGEMSEDVKTLIESTFFTAKEGNFALFVGVIISRSELVASRKALLNMASEAAPTRFVVSGLEIERGLIISKEASLFCKQAVLVYGDTPGQVFIVPQFATKDNTVIVDSEERKNGGFEASGILEFIQAKKNNADMYLTSHLSTVECDQHPCPNHQKSHKNINELDILHKIDIVWWDLTMALLSVSKHNHGALQNVLEEITLSLLQLLVPKDDQRASSSSLQKFDTFPLLLVDRMGPQNGMITNDLVKEIEEFSGLRCFNTLRLSQLAAFGYKIRVLPGAFALSDPNSRAAAIGSCDKQADLYEDHADTGEIISRCDGCFMFVGEDTEILDSIAKDERERVAKAAILWHELDGVFA